MLSDHIVLSEREEQFRICHINSPYERIENMPRKNATSVTMVISVRKDIAEKLK
tara:strand:- start:15229 stop:15390 length:162 start_codon:yes stop_codon:yes gene_type:complete